MLDKVFVLSDAWKGIKYGGKQTKKQPVFI